MTSMPVASSKPRKRVAVDRLLARRPAAPGADQQRQQQLQHGDVEGQRGHGRKRACGVQARRARIDCRKFTTARCGTHTPLGWPVEPEV